MTHRFLGGLGVRCLLVFILMSHPFLKKDLGVLVEDRIGDLCASEAIMR